MLPILDDKPFIICDHYFCAVSAPIPFLKPLVLPTHASSHSPKQPSLIYLHQDYQSLDFNDPGAEKSLCEFWGRAYGLYLSGDDERLGHLEGQLVAKFDARSAILRDQIQDVALKLLRHENEIEEIDRRLGGWG